MKTRTQALLVSGLLLVLADALRAADAGTPVTLARDGAAELPIIAGSVEAPVAELDDLWAKDMELLGAE